MNGTYLRGEVYWLDDGHITYPNGSWMDKRRPVVIVSNNQGNERADAVIVLFLTTQNPQGGHDKVRTYATGAKQSWVMCTQTFTVSKTFLRDYIGALSTKEMDAVDMNLREFLSLGKATSAEDKLAIASRDEIIKVKEEELKLQDRKLQAYGEEVKRLTEEIESLKADLRDRSDNHRYEVDLWQRMYSKAVDSVVTMQLERDVLRRTELRCGNVDKPVVSEIVTEVVEEPPVKVEEPQKVDEPKPEKKPRKPRKKKAPEAVVEQLEMEVIEELKPAVSGKVNVNTATAVEIKEATGMSMTVAFCITGYRKKHGNYTSLEELVNVQRFSKSMLERYRDKMEV